MFPTGSLSDPRGRCITSSCYLSFKPARGKAPVDVEVDPERVRFAGDHHAGVVQQDADGRGVDPRKQELLLFERPTAIAGAEALARPQPLGEGLGDECRSAARKIWMTAAVPKASRTRPRSKSPSRNSRSLYTSRAGPIVAIPKATWTACSNMGWPFVSQWSTTV